MSYTDKDILTAVERMVAIDSEHGKDVRAYAEAVGLPPFIVMVARDMGRNGWSQMVERLAAALDHPEAAQDMLGMEVIDNGTAMLLRGVAIGLLLRQGDDAT